MSAPEQAFLERRLRPGARPIDPAPGALVSPVDGIVLHAGTADVEDLSSTVVRVKVRASLNPAQSPYVLVPREDELRRRQGAWAALCVCMPTS